MLEASLEGGAALLPSEEEVEVETEEEAEDFEEEDFEELEEDALERERVLAGDDPDLDARCS